MRWPQQIAAWWARRRRPKSLGYLGERAAEKFLRRRGYKIVARGSRLPSGELDLVAVDGRTVVFVEVKTRSSRQFGHPEEAVDENKRRRVTRAALAYLKRHGLLEYHSRFDVVALDWPASSQWPRIEHYKNAFEATGSEGLYS
jgi:putative endonuclease